jgi:hypothetical protein
MRHLLRRLPDVLAGKEKPSSPAETCEFALLCAQPFHKRYAATVALFENAFAADPKLATDLTTSHRYNAACFSALAARGEGMDAPAGASDRSALRSKALAWLRADLSLWHKHAASPNPTRRQTAAAILSHWLSDADLSGVRPGPGRDKMSAEESGAWDSLWADVKATLAQAQKPPAGMRKKESGC